VEVRFTSTAIDGVIVVELDLHVDERGGFARTYCDREFEAAGLPTAYPQCNLSVNHRAGTLRGLHFNAEPYCEAKLVRCVRGAIHDVVVDLRAGSPTLFQHVAIELTADNRLALFVPTGCAHGFETLEDSTDVFYQMSSSYVPSAARGIRWDDAALHIPWPVIPTVMSDADAGYPDLDPASFDLSTNLSTNHG
jgi:dTDP-4-dehydrorhamnose 3,5-epimerase